MILSPDRFHPSRTPENVRCRIPKMSEFFLSIGWIPCTAGHVGSRKCNFHRKLLVGRFQNSLNSIYIFVKNLPAIYRTKSCTFRPKFVHSASKVGSMAFPKLFFCVSYFYLSEILRRKNDLVIGQAFLCSKCPANLA